MISLDVRNTGSIGLSSSHASYFDLEDHVDGIIVIGNVSTSSYFLSETSIPQNFTLLYDDIGITFLPLLIQAREVNFLHIDSEDSITDFGEFLTVVGPDLTEEQYTLYRNDAYVGLLSGIQDKILRPIEGVVDMDIVDVQIIQQSGEDLTVRITVSYANSDLVEGDPSLLRLFKVSGDIFSNSFEDITLPDPEGHNLDAKTVTGETSSPNLLALAFQEPSLTEGFQGAGGNFLLSKDSLPAPKIATEKTIDSAEPLVPSVVFTRKASEELSARELFESFLVPTYPSVGQDISKDAIYVLPSILVPHEESKNNFLLSPILSEVHSGTTLLLAQSSFVESELARVERIEMKLATNGQGVGLAFGITDTRPPGTPPPPIDVPALFLNIDFVGNINFSDPAVFESSPTIDILVNKTLPGFEQLEDGCVDFELLLFNEETEEWKTVQKLREPVRDTASECSFALSPGHFSKFGIGGVKGTLIPIDAILGTVGGGGGGGGRGGNSATSIQQMVSGEEVVVTTDVGSESVTSQFELVEPGSGQLKIESDPVTKFEELFDEMADVQQETEKQGIVHLNEAIYSTVGTVFDMDSSDVKF